MPRAGVQRWSRRRLLAQARRRRPAPDLGSRPSATPCVRGSRDPFRCPNRLPPGLPRALVIDSGLPRSRSGPGMTAEEPTRISATPRCAAPRHLRPTLKYRNGLSAQSGNAECPGVRPCPSSSRGDGGNRPELIAIALVEGELLHDANALGDLL